MYHFSVPMALVDFIPVAFFGYAAALLQRDLYSKMVNLYRLDQIEVGSGGRMNLGPIPTSARVLIAMLAGTWVLIALYVIKEAVKKKKTEKH